MEAFDLLNEELAALHLWYLVDDPILLAALMRLGINRWGQLAAFVEHGGRVPDGTETAMPGIIGRVGLLERYQELYRQGRPRRIDRAVLDDSEAISPRFIEEVTERLKELKGNPLELLELLRSRGITGFRTASADELEQYLLSEGYLDELMTIPHDEILLRLQAFLSQHGLEPDKAQQFLERIVGSLADPGGENPNNES
jgi:hypothetical protein